MSIQELYDRLERHDWFYEWSDDGSVWRRGMAAESELKSLAKTIPGGEALMDAFAKHHFTGEPWKTEKQPKPERPVKNL